MSFILSQIIKKRLPEWNERIFSAADLDWLQSRLQVRIVERNEFRRRGEYTLKERNNKIFPFILIKKTVNLKDKIWIAYHEIGHHLLHHPVPHKFSKSLVKKMDREANYFAAIALMPTRLIAEKTFGEIVEEYGYPKKLIQIRKDIWEAYRI